MTACVKQLYIEDEVKEKKPAMKITDKWFEMTEKPKRKRWFDLCLLDLGHKILVGWWTGQKWDGLNYRGNGKDIKRWQYYEYRIERQFNDSHLLPYSVAQPPSSVYDY